jgi:hypothetical protein
MYQLLQGRTQRAATESREQKAENREQRTEIKEQRAESRAGQRAKCKVQGSE